MDAAALKQLNGVENVILTDQTLYVLSSTNTVPAIITDKKIRIIPRQEILTSPHLLDVLQGTQVATQTGPRITKKVLYEYTLSHLTPSEKQSVSHTLSGTGGRSGMLDELGAERIGRGAILIASEQGAELESYFQEKNVAFTTRTLYEEVHDAE